uniref:Transcription factor TFIIIC triple barrel domain-containing protein n=1 Tax=Monopterus albus TaxID=43700 RepID=A0A3Q3IWT8_MONAL
MELSGVISNDFMSRCQGTCKILDIDSDKPMMQVGQYVFAGEYEGKNKPERKKGKRNSKYYLFSLTDTWPLLESIYPLLLSLLFKQLFMSLTCNLTPHPKSCILT